MNQRSPADEVLWVGGGAGEESLKSQHPNSPTACYGSASATSSAGKIAPPVGTTTHCFPPTRYVIGAPVAGVYGGISTSAISSPVRLSKARSFAGCFGSSEANQAPSWRARSRV